MDEITEKCSLCLKNHPDKTNSHIIPKFLSHDLFISPGGNYAIQINRDGSSRKIQSTVKQNYLFCTFCENRFGIIETYISRTFNNLRRYEKYPGDFELHNLGTQEFLKLKRVNPDFFKMFIYSIVWRCSLSNNIANQPFKLPYFIEDQLRSFLDLNLGSSAEYLKREVEVNVPEFHFCIIKPQRKELGYHGMYSTFQISDSTFIIVVNDFIMFFYLDDSIDNVLRNYSNKNNNEIIIALADDKRWFELNKLIVHRMLRSNGN